MTSIIIPIYNASQYIANGYANVLVQTYTNWELIFINDGSLDSSAEILDDLASKDSRVRVIHQSNAGPGIARNTGLKVAKGEWIYFYDADDEIAFGLLQRCVGVAEKHKSDIVTWGFDAYDTQIMLHTYSQFEDCVMYTNNEIGQHWAMLMRQSVIGNGFPWNKLYRRSMLIDNNIWFGEERVMEDELFNLRVLRVAKSMVVLSDVLYTYYCNNAGNSRGRFLANRFEIVTDVRSEMLRCMEQWNLTDQWLNAYIEKRYWLGIKKSLFEDMRHPDNKLPANRKKETMLVICNNVCVQQCLLRLMNNEISFEDKRYVLAILNKKIYTLKIWIVIFRILRKIKKMRK